VDVCVCVFSCATSAAVGPFIPALMFVCENSSSLLVTGFGFSWHRQSEPQRLRMCELLVKCVQTLSFGTNITLHAFSLLLRWERCIRCA
jgi:hypothetical protein